MIRLMLDGGGPILLRLSSIEAIVGDPKAETVFVNTQSGDHYRIQNRSHDYEDEDEGTLSTFTDAEHLESLIRDRIHEERNALTDRSHL